MEATKQTQAVGGYLNNLSPLKIVEDPKVGNKFIALFNGVHGTKSGEAFYHAEKFNFTKVMQENESLQECDKLSLYGSFLDVAVNGLSFDPTKNLVYLVPYSVNVGTRQNAKWIKKAKLHISPYGELLIRQRVGQIKHADNPVLVYEGDTFKVTTDSTGTKVFHECNYGNRTDKLIACFLRIVRNDNSVDFKVMTVQELEVIRKSSKTPNGPSWTNAYGGMFMAKVIKHAFKTYPKVRIGQFSSFETQIEEVDQEYDYSLEADGGDIDHHEEMEQGQTITTDSEPETIEVEEEEDLF